MPKKFKGVNSKAEEARARKSAAKTAERERKEKELEDEYWRDDDKQTQKKQQRKDDREKKRLEALERKQAAKELLDIEEKETKGKSHAGLSKTTRADIAAAQEWQAQAQVRKPTKNTEPELEENPNIKMAELLAAEGAVEARSVEDAISVLSVTEKAEKHPEKRMKAAYAAYEELNLPRLKQENPNMRLSQLKQMLKKDWMKSPENPMNQAYKSFNSKS